MERYHPTKNIYYRGLKMSEPEEATALWLMHHATLACIDERDPAKRQELHDIVTMFHERIDTLTAIPYS